MPFVKVWIRFVWSKKIANRFLPDEIRGEVFHHVREGAAGNGTYLDYIGGYVDHVHCLISLRTNQTIEKIIQLIKGESSIWINKNRLVKTRFERQDEYLPHPTQIRFLNFSSVQKFRRSAIFGLAILKSSSGIITLTTSYLYSFSPSPRILR
ncbi:MAG: REP-associated tyrosine transposase [Blastocatellia bacterium]|nr:REP-associated tyrosine transposase [Blastocatellia bacterium]